MRTTWILIMFQLVAAQKYCMDDLYDSTCTCNSGEVKLRLSNPALTLFYCNQCPEGTFNATPSTTVSTIAASCRNCSVGTAARQPGSTACTLCLPGTISRVPGSSTCSLCFNGTISRQSGSSTCSSCLPGTFSQRSGSSTCTTCFPGTFQSASGASSCVTCRTRTAVRGGFVSPCTTTRDSDLTTCTWCRTGRQIETLCLANNTFTTSPLCVDCPPGYYQPNDLVFNAQCSLCLPGKYQNLAGQASCKDCTMYQNAQLTSPYNFTAQTDACPQVCAAGFFPNPSVTACASCPIGTFRGNLRLTSCSACVRPGNSYFLNSTTPAISETSCLWACEIGFERRGSACVACTEGSFRSSLNTLTCQTCGVCSGAFFTISNCTSTRNATCTPCSTTCGAGRFISSPCSQFENITCASCPDRCNASQFMSRRCTGTQRFSDQVCTACTTPNQCAAGFFLNRNCTGVETQNLQCTPCTTRSCSATQYLQVCTSTSDSICLPLTLCPENTFLDGFNRTSNGACKACTVCNNTVAVCSPYRDTVCDYTLCSLIQPCRGYRSFCLFNGSSVGLCGTCPDGFSGDGLYCYPCPRTKTCNILGEVECEGEVPFPNIPMCVQGYAVPSGQVFTQVQTGFEYSRGLATGGQGVYFRCPVGRYLAHSRTGNQTCLPCVNALLGLFWTYETPGLTINDPESCVAGCTKRYDVTAETCVDYSPFGHAVLNSAFRYGNDVQNNYRNCPANSMSAAHRASNINDCEVCPAVVNAAGDRCRGWWCVGSNALRRGDMCFNRLFLPLIFPIPWQPAGYEKTGINLQWAPSVYSLAQDGPVKAFGSKRYPLLGTGRYVEGAVCSACTMNFGRNYTIFTICGAPAIYYVQMELAGGVTGRVIGTTVGYREGFRQDAQFGNELFVTGFERRLFVADKLNCAVRVVNMVLAVPGMFSARSYLLFGNPPYCEGSQSVNRPYAIFLVSSYVVFASLGGIYGFDRDTRTLAQIAPGEFYNVINITGDTQNIFVWERNRVLTITAASTRCPNGTTSLLGYQCTIICTDGWVDALGVCRSCTAQSCALGQGYSPCTFTQDSVCFNCSALPTGRAYVVPGDCSLSVFVPPCPLNWYANGGACVECPKYSTTLIPGATSRAQCRCLKGTVRDVNSDVCVVRNPYPLPSASKCPFLSYERGVDSVCSSCRVAPYRECSTGFYTSTSDVCLPCTFVNNSRFLTQGLVINAPTSCEWECVEGFYQNASLPFQQQCAGCRYPGLGGELAVYRPISNGGDSPEGCRWTCDYPFKMVDSVCRPCAGYNVLHPGLPCVGPGQRIIADAATMLSYYLDDVKYTAYVFRDSSQITVQQNMTVDVLLAGGGGRGGNSDRGPGGGGAGGQVVLRLRVAVGVGTYTIIVGRGQTQGLSATLSSAFGIFASTGGSGGDGTNTPTAVGVVMYNAGGSGGRGNTVNQPLFNWPPPNLAGNIGGVDLNGRGGGGGGGAGGPGGNSTVTSDGNYTSGNGGDPVNVLFLDSLSSLGAGGAGGCGESCVPGVSQDGAGDRNTPNALPNTGAGGAGGTFAAGGDGGSGVVMVRFVDEPCACL